YLFTGSYKCTSDYLTGEAIYWVMNDLELARWADAQLPTPLFVCKLITWGTLLFELSFAFLIWVGPPPRRVAVLGDALHGLAFLLWKRWLGLSIDSPEVYLAVIGFVLIGLLIWLRYESGTWSGPVAAPDDSVSTGRCVLLAAVVLHETLLQSLALRAL